MKEVVYDPPNKWLDFFNIGLFRFRSEFAQIIPARALNLGAGIKHISGATSLDLPEWDADTMAIPCKDKSVDVIYAIHFLEHVKEPIKLLRECERVLVPGGYLNVVVPYYSSQIASVDLDHKHRFTERTFKNLFENEYYAKNHNEWEFIVETQFILGETERNLCLFSQITKQVE